MGVAASSSASSASSSSSSSKKHEVFLSFRGEDTRRSFTSHLHTALCDRGIETFIDNELRKGDDISQSLIEAIDNSSISVIVFSENYANSKWCLNELNHILLCKEKQGQHVVPIFYQVDPSHVRNQKGTYEEAFAEHLKKNPEKVDEWRKALFITANLAGWDSADFRNDIEFIQNIVKDISKKLYFGLSSAPANIVGIEENCINIESMLQEFSYIGIWGMGGIGKTTMANVVYSKIQSQFDICCFLESFREDADKRGIKYIRNKLLRELVEDTSLEGLRRKKILIVLDDVSKTSHLDYLEKESPLLGPGSKVIITSRDKHVLNGRVGKIHEAKALDENNSFELFNMKAFREDGYKSEYQGLVERALGYAQGNPLALTILGLFLYSKTVKEWESALKRLEKTSDPDIQAVLKLSYDGLEYEDKDIFLDIACFWKGKSREYVTTMLDSCGFHASIGLRNLADKALININEASYCPMVEMHDLIQLMAFEVVHQECTKNPGSRSRLWDPDEIYHVLRNDQGTETIEGISLDLSQIRDLQLSAATFRKMTKLRILKFYSSRYTRSPTVHLPSGLGPFSSSLRYLQWVNFPSESLSLSSFCAEKLVELHMPNSHLKRLWDGMQNLANLRQINLGISKQLIELPDLRTAKNLEKVVLRECQSLSHIDPHFFSLPRLYRVELFGCINLKSLKANSQSKSIRILDLQRCSGLKEFSFSSKKMTNLRLDLLPVEGLDFSLGPMEKLEALGLNCSPLTNLPINDICCMRSLELLHLSNCGGLIDTSKLHTLFDALLSLTNIKLDGACKLSELPNNIKHLSMLELLMIRNCKSLQSLPELPSSIKKLLVDRCSSLKTLQLTSNIESSSLKDDYMNSVGYLGNLEELALRDCEQLYELPDSIGSLSSLQTLDLSGSNVVSLPVSIKHLSKLRSMKLSNCRRLRSLPELPPFIRHVHANDGLSLDNHTLSRVESSLLEDEITLDPILCSSVSYLGNIEELDLCGCEQLYKLPVSIGSLSSLQILDLSGSNVESLPVSIKHLSNLEFMYLSNCRRLRSLPDLPPFIKIVKANGCISLENHSLSRVAENFYYSFKLSMYIEGIRSVCYPGRKAPNWFSSDQVTNASNYVTMELSSTPNNLIGFILCSVLSHHSNGDHDYLLCRLWCDGIRRGLAEFDMEGITFDSDHVFLWCLRVPGFHSTMDDQNPNYGPNMSFEFSLKSYPEKAVDNVIEVCGVCPVYASEYPNFIQQMELKSDMGAQNGTCHAAEENSVDGMVKYANFSLKEGNCGNLGGSIVPEWFPCKSLTKKEISLTVSVQLGPDFDIYEGFIFCLVIPHFSLNERDQCYSSCKWRLYDGRDGPVLSEYYFSKGRIGWHYSMQKSNLDNFFIWYDPLFSKYILQTLKKRGKCDEVKLEFELKFCHGLAGFWGGDVQIDNCLIKECGVRPIFVSEYTDFLRQNKLEVSVLQERHLNIIDEDQHQLQQIN